MAAEQSVTIHQSVSLENMTTTQVTAASTETMAPAVAASSTRPSPPPLQNAARQRAKSQDVFAARGLFRGDVPKTWTIHSNPGSPLVDSPLDDSGNSPLNAQTVAENGTMDAGGPAASASQADITANI